MTLLAEITKLTPTEFEHLVFDLVVLHGLRNATWRTPGSDGGRDIEGTTLTQDFSDVLVLDKWYVECKRYANSVDWPTVYQKIAYAANHQADYLLLCTNSALSPTCKSEVSMHNARKEHVRIRYWDGAILEKMVAMQPVLLSKYRLASSAKVNHETAYPLTQLAAKAVYAAYGEMSGAGKEIASLTLAVALLDLANKILEGNDASVFRRRSFKPDHDAYSWMTIRGGVTPSHLAKLDAYGLRAAVAAFRFYGKCAKIFLGDTSSIVDFDSEGRRYKSTDFSSDSIIIGTDDSLGQNYGSSSCTKLFNQIALLADFEVFIAPVGTIITPRSA